VMLPVLDKSLSSKAFEDFRMVSIWAKYDIIFMTGAVSGVKSMRDLVDRMRAKPSAVNFAAVGQPQLTPTGLAGLVLIKMTNGAAQEINYPGGAPAILDMLAGRVTFTTNTLAGNLSRIQGGQIVALAVATPKRLPQLPEVPTMEEAGFPEFMTANNWSSWIAAAAPRKTPDATVIALNRAIAQAAQSEAFRARIEQLGLTVLATGSASDDQNAWRAEHDRLDGTLKRLDIRLPN
jgi:tripartite-type tricarboxylate transporter receptor subunit TctC